MLTGSHLLPGTVLLALALLASSLAGGLLWRSRATGPRPERPARSSTQGSAVVALGVSAVFAATGAAALSDGTLSVWGWWPFAAGLVVSTLPLVTAGWLLRDPR